MAADTVASEAIEEAAERAAAIADAAEERAETAIEQAAEAIAETEQLQEDLARAALEGERGRQLADLMERVDAWQNKVETIIAENGETRRILSEMQTALAELTLKASQPVVLIPPASAPPSTLPETETVEIPPDPAVPVIVKPESQVVSDGAAVLEEAVAKPVLKRRIWT